MNTKNTDCAYCMKGEMVSAFGYEICELPASILYLFREQSHPGRCIVASKHHVSELIELSPEEQYAFLDDVAAAAGAIHSAFHPDKLNYGMYGDTGHHLHMHLVPKYREEFEWGGTFAMDPKLKKLDDAGCEEPAARIREALGK